MDQTLLQDSFRTKDLYEAAALYCKNIPLLTLEREKRICWFVFDHFEDGQRISDSYWSGSLLLCARDYANAIRTLKDRIFSQ